MDPNRKLWNERQKALQLAIKRKDDIPAAVELFLQQHAMLHTAEMAQTGEWSFEDEVWHELSEKAARCIPPKQEHSIAWAIWHITRIEDITMNMLLAGEPQLLFLNGWYERMKISARDTGNGMSADEISRLSVEVDLTAMRAYRLAVGRRTREIVQGLSVDRFKLKVEADRLQQVLAVGAVSENETWLINYWGKHTYGSLLLMPPTRHILVHLNEALQLKRKIQA